MAATGTQVSGGGRQALAAVPARATFAAALRSEYTKIRSVRSTYWTLLALVIVTIGIGVLACVGAVTHGPHGPGFDPTQRSLAGLFLGQLIIVVLGALTITSEYSTGMISTSLTIQPRRGIVLAAKGAVFAAVSLVTGLVACFIAFFAGQSILASKHLQATLGQPHVLRAVIGGALFLTVCGMLSFGLGVLLRHTAGAITAAIGLLLVLPLIVNFLPASWQAHIDKWIPLNAGTQIWRTVVPPGTGQFSAWTGLGVFAAYAAVAIIAGAVLFHRRDA